MDKTQTAALILEKALPHVPFDGWTQAVLERACKDAELDGSAWFRVFPLGAVDALDAFAVATDQAMLDKLHTMSLEQIKIRERIAIAVRVRLTQLFPHREAVRRAVGFYLLPVHTHHGLRVLYRTVDDIWHAVGDNSTDFNFYSKRLILSAVYTSTLQIWLNDNSKDQQATWEFLNRRIENVMQFERAKQRVRNLFS